MHRWHRKLYRRYTLDDETLETHVRLEIERFDFRSKGPCSPQARPILVVLGEVRASNASALRIVGAMWQQKIVGEGADNDRHNILTSPSAPSRHEARIVTTNRPLLVNY